ncbi:hypothetical protein ACTHAM_002376 [Cellulomonas soli]|uniref:hypothetical protein n=1 Tax=Cellulomonas soli TaxID=931535 RepID=UPI003F8532EE
MTTFTVPRGQFRALLAASAPHTGKESEDTPLLGRVRFHPLGDRLLAWTTDYTTSVVSSITIDQHRDADLETFDLQAAEVARALAVFKPPAGDARMMWDDAMMRVRVTTEHVVFTEEPAWTDVAEGRSLQVLRIVPEQGQDRYPDVPRLVVEALFGQVSQVPQLRVFADHLARFQAAGKAWNAPIRLEAIENPVCAVIRIGERVVGLLPAYPDDTEKERTRDRRNVDVWVEALSPIRRPVRVEVPADVVTDLQDQARELLRSGSGVHLSVVKAGDPS